MKLLAGISKLCEPVETEEQENLKASFIAAASKRTAATKKQQPAEKKPGTKQAVPATTYR
jgi:hypothetical protein